jgi:hypothetical protein
MNEDTPLATTVVKFNKYGKAEFLANKIKHTQKQIIKRREANKRVNANRN